MSTSFSVSDLSIEVTRRCNMRCDHCLRGDAENLDINFEYIRNMISALDRIGCITFTGGEPSLNIAAIRFTLQEISRQGKTFVSFYVVTNGLENQSELAVALLEAYGQAEYKEGCGVSLSIDMFHAAHGTPNERVRGLAFYSSDKEHNLADDNLAWVISTGKANDNGFGEQADIKDYNFPAPENVQETAPDDPNRSYELPMLYLSATGRVYPEANATYRDADDGTMQSMDCTTLENFTKDLNAWADGKFREQN